MMLWNDVEIEILELNHLLRKLWHQPRENAFLLNHRTSHERLRTARFLTIIPHEWLKKWVWLYSCSSLPYNNEPLNLHIPYSISYGMRGL